MISKACDIYNIPIATNIATAESLVIGLQKVIWSGGKIYDDHRRWESFHVCRRPWYVPLRYAQYVREAFEKTAGNKMKELLGILTSNHFMAVVVEGTCHGDHPEQRCHNGYGGRICQCGHHDTGNTSRWRHYGSKHWYLYYGVDRITWTAGEMLSKAFSPSLYAPLLVGIGAFLIMFSKRRKADGR